MALDKCGHTATLKLVAQRPTIHYTSVNLRDLVVVLIAWLTTMECSLPLQTGTMMSGDLTVQATMEAVDGGTRVAVNPNSPIVTVQNGGIGLAHIHTTLSLR